METFQIISAKKAGMQPAKWTTFHEEMIRNAFDAMPRDRDSSEPFDMTMTKVCTPAQYVLTQYHEKDSRWTSGCDCV